MLACKHCSTPNSLDSTFCKKCGTAVPQDQKREALVQLDKLVDEGLAALNAGRTAEALAIADSAIATDPSHMGALHLKSAVHERRGEIADALESAERIVELNPDSELDRIKRNGLRTSLLNASNPAQPDRRIAFAAAAATMVLVACGGILLARRPETPASAVASNVAPATTGAPVVVNPVAAPTTAAQPASQPPISPVTNPDIGGTTPVAEIGRGRLPVVSGTGGGIDVHPIDPVGPLPLVNGPDASSAPKPPTPKPSTHAGDDPEPGVIHDPKPIAETKPEDNGLIDISISNGGPRRTGGSQTMPETRTNGTQAYAQVGTERFGLGDYAGAATNLEKAVAGGGDAVQLNLRLAQAYSHLGRSSDAATAYERSRAAADAALKSGRGDKERLAAARDAADAGLRTVRGG